ncbi:hypothetical protein L798_08833 [Zootermopsis nevadensis]|uniref:Secreted protein n=1 Tax=Zootermopsis nevadensis TaxID=136037 RepID=A0A067RBT7_ZOONE|nr:hypothetical protein L798_08833 [Zootermopsis nevadensis]
MCRQETLLPLAIILMVTLQWGGRLQVVVANDLEDCAARELRCEILCHLVELELQCAKCRSRAPVRFGKRIGENFRLTKEQNPNRSPQLEAMSHSKNLQRVGGLGQDGLCCGQFLSLLLHNSKIGLHKK